MTDLIDSLRELAREHGTITPIYASLDLVVRRAVDAVVSRPDFRNRDIVVKTDGDMEGSFDPRKLERVFFNLALNACEATAGKPGRIVFEVQSTEDRFTVRVSDNGPGVPTQIQGEPVRSVRQFRQAKWNRPGTRYRQ